MSGIMNSSIYYQQLRPQDKPGMMLVCKNCFPINYPEDWYDNLLKTSRNTYSLGAFDKETDQLVGIIFGQIQNISDAEDEVGTLLESRISDDDCAVYITIFGILESFRRLGIGTNLMKRLLSDALNRKNIRTVYLHVESSNNTAITFYECKGFSYFTTIHGYYHFESTAANGVVYVLFINGGKRYTGGFSNWCKRYVKQGSVGQCFSRAYDTTSKLLTYVFYDQQDST